MTPVAPCISQTVVVTITLITVGLAWTVVATAAAPRIVHDNAAHSVAVRIHLRS
jgi:hypothetical protein